MSTVHITPASSEIQTILNAWSMTLLLDGQTGESIITEFDLIRLTQVLSRYLVHSLTTIHNTEPRDT
jgi:hypothetical protein